MNAQRLSPGDQVTLTDGKHHSVDSSELAFRKAGAQAMREALVAARPVQLEPVNEVSILVPSAYIAGIQKIVLGRRGQIFRRERQDGGPGWEAVAYIVPTSRKSAPSASAS